MTDNKFIFTPKDEIAKDHDIPPAAPAVMSTLSIPVDKITEYYAKFVKLPWYYKIIAGAPFLIALVAAWWIKRLKTPNPIKETKERRKALAVALEALDADVVSEKEKIQKRKGEILKSVDMANEGISKKAARAQELIRADSMEDLDRLQKKWGL